MSPHGPIERVSWLVAAALAGLCSGAAAASLTPSPAGSPPVSSPAPATAATPRATGGGSQSAAAASAAAPPSSSSAPVSWFAGGDTMYVPPYYDSFKGLDLGALTSAQKERFLHWVNTEFCTCSQSGCERDTIANCYTNDSACPRAPVRIKEILEKVKQGGAAPSRAPLPAAPPPPGK